MPTYQTIIVDITPGAKEKPVLNASQFDNGRPFNVALTWGGAAFTDAGDFDIEIHVKKPDGNIVTAEPDSVVNEVCAFLTTEQMCACHGINECEIVLFDNDIQIGTGNFILDVEKAPDEGGIQSASEIANLATQVDAITLAYLVNNTDEIAEIIANKIYPTLEASGDIATFNTILQLPLVSVDADPLATIITRCGKNLCYDENSSLFPAGDNLPIEVNSATHTAYVRCLPNTTVYFKKVNATNRTYFYGCNDAPTDGVIVHSLSYTEIIPNVYSVNSGAYKYIALYYSNESSENIMACLNQANINEYEAYNGITKPITEATTIPTLTGVNNVFTDYGPVIVDYKYFPDI